MRGRFLAALLWLCMLGAVAVAQTPATPTAPQPDFAAWDIVANRAEQILAVDAASDAVLTSLRAEIAGWRTRFLDSVNASAGRLQTVRQRLAALPPPPEEGVAEPPLVAEERARLRDLQERLETPSLRAQLAFAHADGLVREIDEVLRQRQTTRLTERLPTPLNPLNWGTPLQEIAALIRAVPVEMADYLGDPEGRGRILQILPATLILLGAGVLLLTRAHRWVDGMERAALTRGASAMRVLLGGFAAILQLLLPILGLVALFVGIGLLGVLGETGNVLLQGVAAAASFAIFSTWLLARVYTVEGNDVIALSGLLPQTHARRARRVALAMCALLSVKVGFDAAAVDLGLSAQAEGFVRLVLSLLLAPVIYRLASFYRGAVILPEPPAPDDGDAEAAQAPPEIPFQTRVVAWLSGVARAVAVLSVLCALAGFIAGASFAIAAAAFSFLYFAALTRGLVVVQRAVALARGRPDDRDTGLVATLIFAGAVLLSLPLLAFIWGARWTDLSELWIGLRDGIRLGEVTLSPASLLTLGLVFGGLVLMTRLVQGLLSDTILPKTRLEIGAQRAITSGIGYVGFLLAGLLAVSAAGLNLSSLAIVAGALSVGIGFGLQTIVSNFVSGIILLIERPVAEGDWIEVGGQMGYVRAISVRATRIETFDRTDVIVPNSDLIANQVTNWTRGNLIGRAIVPVSVARGTDTRKVERILREIAEAHPMVAIRPAPLILFMGFADGALNFEIRAILRDVNFLLTVKSDINHAIAERFADEDVEMPFPQRDLRIRRLAATAGPTGTAETERQGPILRRGPDLLAAGDMDGDADGDAR